MRDHPIPAVRMNIVLVKIVPTYTILKKKRNMRQTGTKGKLKSIVELRVKRHRYYVCCSGLNVCLSLTNTPGCQDVREPQCQCRLWKTTGLISQVSYCFLGWLYHLLTFRETRQSIVAWEPAWKTFVQMSSFDEARICFGAVQRRRACCDTNFISHETSYSKSGLALPFTLVFSKRCGHS